MLLGKVEVRYSPTNPDMVLKVANAEDRLKALLDSEVAKTDPADLRQVAQFQQNMMQGVHDYFASLFGAATAAAILAGLEDGESHINMLNSFREQMVDESAKFKVRMSGPKSTRKRIAH